MAINTNNRKTTLEDDASIYTPDRELSEKDQWRSMNSSERKTHFKEYYMIPVIITLAITFVVGYLIYDAYINYRDVVYVSTIINDTLDPESLDSFNNDMLEYLGHDSKRKEVRFEDSYLLSGASNSDALVAKEKITSYIYAKQLDSMIADADSFDHYASLGCFSDLSQVLPEDLYNRISEYIYYPNIIQENSPAAGVSDTVRPTETYPCGINLAASSVYNELGGAQTNPVIGIVITSEHIEDTIKILEYLYP